MDEPLGGYDEAASDPAEVKQPIALSVGMGILVGALVFIGVLIISHRRKTKA